MHDLFQVRRKACELALGAASSQCDSAREVALVSRDTSVDGRRDGVVALAAHLAQVGELPVLESLGVGLRAIQQARDARRGQQRVVLGLERGQLLAAHVGAAARHHHRGVPAQQRERATEGVQALELLLELLVGRG